MATPSTFSEVSGETLNVLRNKAYAIDSIERVSYLSYKDFFVKRLVPNCPCVFSPELTQHWRSRTEWVENDGTPNFCHLSRLFGSAVVPVANCKQEQYSSHPKQDLTLADYLSYWQKYRSQGYPTHMPCLYLKDWHFTKAFPDYGAYELPVFFKSDWLNEYWDTLPEDDYRFVYMGPKGTWTPFHSDVYRSFSWSANICGRKKWIFYPPGCEECLKDCYGNLVYDVTSANLADSSEYPRSAVVQDRIIEVIQERGEVIFVPSGWHHQVINLEDTISINHNWLNACNVDISWQHLLASHEEVKVAIEDCRDMDGWHDQCQLILKANAGIDFKMFIEMLEVIAYHRLQTWKLQGYRNTWDPQADNTTGDSERTETDVGSPDQKNREIDACIANTEKSETNITARNTEIEETDAIACNTDNKKTEVLAADAENIETEVITKDTEKRIVDLCICGTEKDFTDLSADNTLNRATVLNISDDETKETYVTGGAHTVTTADAVRTNDTGINESGVGSADTDNKDTVDSAGRYRKCGACVRSNSNSDLLSGKEFIYYDLTRIQEVLREMQHVEDLGKLSSDYMQRVRQLLEAIKTCLL